mgnify:FL=1
MTGEERRSRALTLLERSVTPLTGTELARRLGVSRQVIVQDIALLKAQGADVVSTSRGYRLMPATSRPVRLLKVFHGPGRVGEELRLIVDLGGTVEDTLVSHRAYGRLSAPLGISSRSDVTHFEHELASSKSGLLSEVTSGYHFHHVSARDEATLDAIEEALGSAGFLAERSDWERTELG